MSLLKNNADQDATECRVSGLISLVYYATSGKKDLYDPV